MMWKALLLVLLLVSPLHAQTMGISPAGATPSVGFSANAVDYDGTSDFLVRGSDLTGAADDNQGVFSLWFRLDGGDGNNLIMFDTTDVRHRHFRNTSNSLNLQVGNTAATLIFQESTTGCCTSSGTWHHFIMSWDNDVPTCQLYIDDVVETVGGCTMSGTVDGTQANWYVAALNSEILPFHGCFAELYYNQTEHINLDITANRRDFISAGGAPVDLGSTGSTPTGNAPIIYLNGVAASVGTNAGTGGNFTINGSPGACSTSPSD